MITITIPKGEAYDSARNLFYRVEKDTTLQLEHSLISLQKWEARWHKSFLDTKKKNYEETIDYIRCMCLTSNVNPDIFYCIPASEMNRISAYIEDPMTATWFREPEGPGGKARKQVVTAEIIYYWMICNNIPSEYKKWHLNQLLTLIKVANIKNSERMVNGKKPKRSRDAILRDYAKLNEENKRKYHTNG